MGFLTMFVGEGEAGLSPWEPLRQALRLVVHNWRREPLGQLGGGPGLYHYGEAALSLWADDLARTDTLTEAEREKLTFVSGWNFASLLDARRAAADFLERQGALLRPGAQQYLRQAREVYARKVALLEAQGTEGLREAARIESKAVGHLEQALTAAQP